MLSRELAGGPCLLGGAQRQSYHFLTLAWIAQPADGGGRLESEPCLILFLSCK